MTRIRPGKVQNEIRFEPEFDRGKYRTGPRQNQNRTKTESKPDRIRPYRAITGQDRSRTESKPDQYLTSTGSGQDHEGIGTGTVAGTDDRRKGIGDRKQRDK